MNGAGRGHFVVLFDRTFRENDYLWGRLDAAERLVGLLLEDPDQPGTPPGPAECQAVFKATLVEEHRSLTNAPDLVRELGQRIEALS